MKEKVRKERTKKITISEFKIWLDGISTFQAEDWTPNAAQWQVIKDKVECLVDDVKIVNNVVQVRNKQENLTVEVSDETGDDGVASPGEEGHYEEPVQIDENGQPIPVSRQLMHGAIPVTRSSLMAASAPRPTVEQVSSRVVQNLPGGGQHHKTASIDTSGGGYKSQF